RPISNLARAVLGIALGRLGRFSDALVHATTALQIAKDADQAYSLSSSAYELGNIWLLKGEYKNAARDFEQCIEVWHTLQAPRWDPPVVALGLAYCRMGRISEGLALIEGVAEASRVQAYQPSPEALSSEAYLVAGRISDAASQARQLLVRAREKGQ